MDDMMQAYMEETEDMLQRAEECIIRLEMEYSHGDVNELFRIAHTIKGSSHMVGYEDIGNLMHKIEDMLDCARNGSILFDQSIVSLCFEGLDIVKKILEYKREPGSQEILDNLTSAALRVNEMVEVFIRVNKKVEEKVVIEKPGLGIVSSHFTKKPKGKNKYYITFFFEEDAPMVSPVIMMILNTVEELGTLVYSSVDDSYFSESSGDMDIKTYDIIISTDIDETNLYTYFALFYIEKINIIDLTRSGVEKEHNNSKGNRIVSIFECEGNNFIPRLKNFISMVNKSLTLILLIDLSKLTILTENEVKALIEIKKQLEVQGIEIGFVVEGPYARRIINIFDSITQIEAFHVFGSERDAIVRIFSSEDFALRISKRVEDVKYVE